MRFLLLPVFVAAFFAHSRADAGCNPCVCGPAGELDCPGGGPSGTRAPRVELPREWELTTYVDCVAPEDKTTRVRVAGFAAPEGNFELISVLSDSALIAQDKVLSHVLGKQEVYQGRDLQLVLRREGGVAAPVPATLKSAATRLPAEHFSCRQLR